MLDIGVCTATPREHRYSGGSQSDLTESVGLSAAEATDQHACLFHGSCPSSLGIAVCFNLPVAVWTKFGFLVPVERSINCLGNEVELVKARGQFDGLAILVLEVQDVLVIDAIDRELRNRALHCRAPEYCSSLTDAGGYGSRCACQAASIRRLYPGATTILIDERTDRTWTDKAGQDRFQRRLLDAKDRAITVAEKANKTALTEELRDLEYRDICRTAVFMGELGITDQGISRITGHKLGSVKSILETYMIF